MITASAKNGITRIIDFPLMIVLPYPYPVNAVADA